MCIPDAWWFGFSIGALLMSSFWAGWAYYHFTYCRGCLAALLIILRKLNHQGIYFTLEDRAAINVAIECYVKTK